MIRFDGNVPMASPNHCPICGYEGGDFSESLVGQWSCPRCGEGFGEAKRGGDMTTAVLVPAVLLACVGGLSAAAGAGWLAVNVMFMPEVPPPPEMEPAERGGYLVGFYASSVGIPLFTMLIGLIQLAGGIQMARLRQRGFAMAASIVSLIPCSCGVLLGAPVGIWSLIIMSRPEAARLFR